LAKSEHQLSIDTPELVGLEFPLAGLLSRALALLLDYLLQGIAATLLILFFVLLASGIRATSKPTPAPSARAVLWAEAFVIAIPFVLQWGYFTLFEAFWNGQTPGKRMMKLRVISQTGRAITFFESLIRNFLRFVDSLPGVYAVGAISIVATRRQQRLGDLAAGTLVVHERPVEEPIFSSGGTRTFTAAAYEAYTPAPIAPAPRTIPADAVARLTEADLQAIESFLARRLDLPLDARGALAARLAERMARRVEIDLPTEISVETFLEELAATRRDLGR
jgi:uncharacterized RDD family membrane protein YckC